MLQDLRKTIQVFFLFALIAVFSIETIHAQKPSKNQTKQNKPTAEIITENANLRESSNASSEVIREVAFGERFFLSDSQPVGAWYKVVDVKTRKEGWLHGNTFKIVTGNKSDRPQNANSSKSESPSPRPMSAEKAFYYFVAIYGQTSGVVERYGKFFDASNYARAMADEFERNRYWQRLIERIKDGVSKVDFSEKFTLVAQATLGEYSFGSQSFPIVWLPEYSTCCGQAGCRDSCPIPDLSLFRVRDAVNGNDFNWSVPMPETDASAFVKSRSTAGTSIVDRSITVRITYSVVNKEGRYQNIDYPRGRTFSPFIYSVETYGDESLTKKLGVIPKINSLGASTAEEWRLAKVAAQTATKEIGKYRNMIEYRTESGLVLTHPPQFISKYPQLFGTITLTDVGVTSLDEQPNVSSKTRSFNFFDSPAMSLWRANASGYLNPDKKFYSVVWRPFGSFQFESPQERDRFFVDITRAVQEWKTKYAPFQFAAGEVNIEGHVR